MTAPLPGRNARNIVTGGRDAFVMGTGRVRAAVYGVVTAAMAGGGEVRASVGTWTEECIPGLSVYVIPLPVDTRDFVDPLGKLQGSCRSSARRGWPYPPVHW